MYLLVFIVIPPVMCGGMHNQQAHTAPVHGRLTHYVPPVRRGALVRQSCFPAQCNISAEQPPPGAKLAAIIERGQHKIAGGGALKAKRAKMATYIAVSRNVLETFVKGGLMEHYVALIDQWRRSSRWWRCWRALAQISSIGLSRENLRPCRNLWLSRGLNGEPAWRILTAATTQKALAR